MKKEYLKYIIYGILIQFILSGTRNYFRHELGETNTLAYTIAIFTVLLRSLLWGIITSHIADKKKKDTFWSFIFGAIFGLFAAIYYSFIKSDTKK